jgi:hypothetical protein
MASGARLPKPQEFIVAYDRARPRVCVMRGDGVWSHDVVTRFDVLVIARARLRNWLGASMQRRPMSYCAPAAATVGTTWCAQESPLTSIVTP